jgi:hypothetical protein
MVDVQAEVTKKRKEGVKFLKAFFVFLCTFFAKLCKKK